MGLEAEHRLCIGGAFLRQAQLRAEFGEGFTSDIHMPFDGLLQQTAIVGFHMLQ